MVWKTFRAELSGALNDFLALVLPECCALCDKPGQLLCADCAEGVSVEPKFLRAADDLVISYAVEYSAEIATLMYKYKEQAKLELASTFASWFLQALIALLQYQKINLVKRQVHFIAPPDSLENYRHRGFRPVRSFVSAAGFRVSELVSLTRQPLDQSGLNQVARSENLFGSMRGSAKLVGKLCILVDDVYTTGSTIAELARAAKSAGAIVLGAAVLTHPKLNHNKSANTVSIPRNTG